MNAKKINPGVILNKYGIYIVLVVMVVILSIISPTFFTGSNILNILRQVSISGILAIGMTFILITGGIDLSIGSVLALAGVLGATFAHSEPSYPLILVLVIGIGTGVACGLINGLLISRTTINPFIVTMGMMTIARGLALLYTNGRPVTDQSEAFSYLGRGQIGPVTFPVILFILIAVVSIIILHKSVFGKYVYAVGGNEQSAIVSGINTAKIKLMVYLYSGALVGLAGLLLAARTNAATPNAGDGYELDAIAAAVIGGTSTAGGKGGIYGTIVGALIMTILANGMDILNISSYIQQIVKGIIIIAAVFIDQMNKKGK